MGTPIVILGLLKDVDMKISVDANRMSDMEISKVSLVKRGANREPFTFLKTEDAPAPDAKGSKSTLGKIVDGLGNLFASKPEASAPAIRAVMVKEGRDDVASALEDAGFAVDDADSKDGVVVYKQDGYDADSEGMVFKLGDDVAVATDVVKYFTTYSQSTDFGEQIKSQSFWPGFYSAGRALEEVFYNVLEDAGRSRRCRCQGERGGG